MIPTKTSRNLKLDYHDLPQKRQLLEPQRCGSDLEPVNAV